jgi:biopolymer transport protein ExbD
MPLKTTPDEPPTMNMIPMIDIMFNLIIFFLVSTEFASLDRDIALRVPEVKAAGALSAAPSHRTVDVYRDGRITLDGQTVTLRELTRRLAHIRSGYSDLRVVVQGDGRGAFQRVAEALTACKDAGIQELGIKVRLIPPEAQ